jgi:hypothetical protein
VWRGQALRADSRSRRNELLPGVVAKKLTCAILPVVRAAKIIEFDCNDAREISRAERKENQCDMLNR